MKTRPTKIARTVPRRRRFALHPLSFAICLGLSGAAWALPQGGKVVAGDATINKPNTNSEIIRQTTDKAIIDWKSFSIAAGEKVRFYQPSSTSVTLNRVTGYDPSYILGQMSSNGKIFLLNPYGVVFGAGARVDVGGLVVSTLSMANNDFLASRYSLTSIDPVAPAQRGAIVNDGTISAPGGVVVLAGPSVTNTGTIVANGGRVGLVAANSVSIDVEGDGLLFFQTSATEAKNRLEQLGRIQADGGSVELRAAARGAFADTVLNMTGVVQAKTIGSREGKIVIDGGSEGVTAVSGRLDASGLAAGEHGGAVTVQGQYILLDNGSRIEASGDAGGGAIRVGGDFHGANQNVRDAEKTIVMPDAELHADAITRGNGGSLVVWANDWTRYYGNASAKGGAQGGNGGTAEVSGKQSLDYEGLVDMRAPHGAVGSLLMDPTNFTISTAGAATGTLDLTGNVYTDPANTPSNITPAQLVIQLNTASTTIDTTALLLASAGTITVVDPVSWNSAFSLTLKADSTITVNAAGGIANAGIGGLNLFTNAGVVLNGAVSLRGGDFIVANKAGVGRAVSFTSGAGGTISTAGGVTNVPGGAINIQTTGAISTQALTTSGGTAAANGNAAGSVTLNSSGGAITTAGAVDALGSAGVGANKDGGAGGTIAITANGLATVNANITTTGGTPTGTGTKGAGGSIAVQGNGVTVAAGQTFNADDNTITVNGGGGAIQLNTSTLTTTSNAANAIVVRNATTAALGNLTTGATGATTLGVAGDITGAVTQTAATAITTGTLTGSTAGAVTLGLNNAITTLGAFTTNGAFTLNDTTGGLNVSGAVTTANNGVASISTTGGNLAVAVSGSVAGAGVSLTTTGANDITLAGPVNGNAGTVTLDSGQAISQIATGTINTTGLLALNAGGAITLDQGNTIANLGGVTRGGAFTLNDTTGGLVLNGSIGTDASAVTITTAGGALQLGANNITTTTGAGTVTLTGVGVSQVVGTITAGGATTVNAGTGSITLLSTTNDFTGAVTLNSTGASAAVQDANALTLGTLAGLGPNTGLTAIAGTTLTLPGSAINTGTGSIDLEAKGGTLTTPNTLTTTTGSITLVGSAGLTIANALTTTSGPISLKGGGAGGLTVNTGITVDAGNSTITADGGGTAIQLNDSTLTTTSNAATAITVRDATTVALGNLSTGATGTTTLGVAADITGAVTQTAATAINTGTLTASTAGAITLDQGNTITNLGAVTRGGAFTLNDTGGGLNVTGNVTGGTTTNAVSITTAGGALALGTSNITTTGANNLTLTGTGVTQTTGTLLVGGTTTVNAGTGSIDLQSTTNDFTGAVTLISTGASAAVQDANALTLGTLAGLGPNTGLTAIAGTTLTLPGSAINTGTGSIDLEAKGGTLTTPNILTTTTGSITLVGSAGLTIANALTTTSGPISLTTTNSAITESAGAIITTTGATTFAAGTGTVTLGQNNILNSVGGTGGTVSITEASGDGVVLAATNATNLTVTTTQAGVAVTQNAPLIVSGTTTINTTGGGAITLADGGNNFGSFGASAAAGAVSVADSNAIALNAIAAASLLVNTSVGNGAVTQTAPLNVSGAATINAGTGAITLGAANLLGSFGATGGVVSLTENSVGGIALDDVVATSLTVDTSALNGNITQTTPLKALTVTGATSMLAGTGSVLLINAGNNFGSFGATAGAVSVTDSNALALDAINAASLTVNTNNGALTQNAAAVVTGSTVVATGTGAITLSNAGNDFSNTPGDNSFTGGTISVRDTNALTVTTLTSGLNQSVSVVAGGALNLPASGINTGSGDITLSSGAALGTPGPLVGNNISLTGVLGVGIGSDVTAASNLSLTTTNTAVNQTAGKIFSGGTTTVTAGTGAVTLVQPLNDFNAINVVSGGVVNINDANALTAAANAGGTLTITSTGALSSGGTLAGTNVSLTGTGGINLANNVNASGTLQLTTTNNAINQTAGAITATAALTTVNAGSGDITLNQAGNDFGNVSGINATGGAVRLRDANALVIAGLVNGANKDLSLTAGTTISGLAGNIDTGSADLAITSGAGFTTFGTLRGTNVTLGGGTGGLSIGNNVTALNNLTLNATNAAITQTAGTISAAGTTTATAGTGNVTLALAGNNFATFTATANAINVSDDNGLTLGPINTATLTLNTSAGNGAVTQSGAAVVSGATTITAGTGAVTLTNAGNDFANIGVTGGAVAITDINALALNAINATDLAVNTSAGNGNVSQNAAAIVSGATAVNAGTGTVLLTNVGNNFGSVGATGSVVTVTDINALALDATNATTLTLTAGGPITQNGAAVVSGATTANAGANAITLTNAGNNFGSVGATGGAVSITDSNALALDAINATSLTLNTAGGNGNVTQNAAAIVSGATTVNAGTGAVTLTNVGNNFGSVAAIGGAVSVTDINALALGAINATTLTVNTSAGNGAVTQTGAAVVSGPSNVNAGTGAVTLTNAGNDFSTLGVTGGAISVVDVNALTLSSLASAPNQAVNVSAGGLLTLPATAIDTGSASLTLSSSGALTTVGTLRGTNVALSSGGTMTLANNVTALGTLGLTTTNAAISQTGGTILATGPTTVSAGTGNIALAQPTNDFQGNLSLSGGAINVRDTNNLTLSSLSSGANQAVSIIAGGSLVLPVPPVPIDTGTADLTLQALGGTLAINGPISGKNVTLTGTAGLTLGANITSSGDQIYTTAVQLSGNVTLNSGASKIDLQGGANGGGNNLGLTSSNAAADAIHTGAAITNTAQFTVTGNSTLGGNVTTTGNQTYTGPVVLGTDVALASGAAKIDLQGAVNAANHNLALTSSNAAADAIRAEAAITNAAQLTVTGKSTLASGVSTTGTQLYSDTVTLGSNSNFIGSSLSFGNGIVAGTFDLGLQSDALTLIGAVTGSGNAALSSATQNASVGVAGGAGTYQISQATLDKFASFAGITVGRADGTGDLTFGNLSLPTNFAVQSASGNANFTGTVASAAGQSRDLTVTTGGTTTFAGAVGGAIGGPTALGNLSVAGATDLNADTTTNANQSFGGPVTVGANATLSATAVSFASSLDVGTQAVTILSDALSLAGPATGSGTGSVRLAPKTASGSIGVAGAAGTLQVSQGLINTLAGVPALTLGRADSTGAVSVGNLVLPADLTITNGTGSVAFAGTVDSAAGPARNLAITTAGTTSFTGAVGSTRAVNALTVSGTTQLGTSIVTSGAQTYTGATTLIADSTLSGSSVSFGSTVDGARALTVNAAATNFTGAVGSTTALTSLTTDAAGTTQLGGNVTTTGTQTYNDALQLNGNAVLTGSTLNLAGSVDGAHTLAVNGSTGVTLGSAIGAGAALTSLSTSGPLQLNASVVTTTGAQSYAGKTTLGAATALTASSIAFGDTLDGGFGLTLQSAGPTSFAGAVGATTALASLTANGGGAVQLAGSSIDTTGAQSYSGALQLSGTTRLTGSALTLTGAVSGATDLTLQTNSLTGGTSIAGTGVLTIAPIDPTLSIGVAGGAGTLQVSQAVLDGAAGFTGHVIGRSDGSGTVSAGNLVLRADTTLQNASGDMNLGGTVDGAFALTLNSGGTTRITGPVGVTTALKSLTTDNNAAIADWNGTTGERTTFDTADGTGRARVITTGAQTYNDPVTASVPISFTGGAITATQATNRFDGAVSANAASLDLRSSVNLLLGGITLQNGGTIETDGILHLTGALQLNGGTLILTSNATPTPIELTDPEFAGKTLSFGFVPVKEASATIVQDAGATLASTAGSLLVLRSPAGGSLLLDQPGNTLLGQISAVSGTLGDTNTARFSNATTTITLGLIRIVSSEINVAGAPPTNGDQTVTQAGLEGDVIKLTADVLTTGPNGLIRARLPFNNLQGSQTSVPALTFVLSPTALANGGGFGSSATDTFIRVQVGGSEGGFITARPKGVGGNTAVIFLGGDAQVRPFYDGTGKLTEIRVFYNGDAPRTPQEAGALAAVIALIEEARHARFDEAVRTENVSSRLRSGVIAEVGAGRPATVGRESIRLPDTCEIKPKTLRCE